MVFVKLNKESVAFDNLSLMIFLSTSIFPYLTFDLCLDVHDFIVLRFLFVFLGRFFTLFTNVRFLSLFPDIRSLSLFRDIRSLSHFSINVFLDSHNSLLVSSHQHVFRFAFPADHPAKLLDVVDRVHDVFIVLI